METLRLIDRRPPCLDTIIEFSEPGNVRIITDDNGSDTFTLSIEGAKKIIKWLETWKRKELAKREAENE